MEHKESSVDMLGVEKTFQHNTNTAIKKANNKVNLVIHKGFSDIELSNLIASGK